MLALRPQARFGGQPGRKARLLGRRSSRGHCGGVGFRGRDESRPYEQILCFGLTGIAAATRAGVGRGALTPPDRAAMPRPQF